MHAKHSQRRIFPRKLPCDKLARRSGGKRVRQLQLETMDANEDLVGLSR